MTRILKDEANPFAETKTIVVSADPARLIWIIKTPTQLQINMTVLMEDGVYETQAVLLTEAERSLIFTKI